ncbi:MAG: PIG-L family deacetylase [Lentisphaeraceae bacterium]|nr:PIG-L family deacetylase [Lentisphaeraceae bacterium]
MSSAYNQYLDFVKNFAQIHKQAANIPLGESSIQARGQKNGPKVMICSPHPDDECVVGALPLRMLQEIDANVINVAVTLGSNKDRKNGRLAELKKACETLNFELLVPCNGALDGVNPASKKSNPDQWQTNVDIIKSILAKELPEHIFFPHVNDFNSTHIGVNLLVMDAINQVQKSSPSWTPIIFETEFWHMMEQPNLLVAISDEDEAKLIYALSAHTGEVERNPYHVNHPARMLDNVTRGAEVVGGQGGEAPKCNFAMIYKCSKVVNGKATPAWEGGKMLGVGDDLKNIL